MNSSDHNEWERRGLAHWDEKWGCYVSDVELNRQSQFFEAEGMWLTPPEEEYPGEYADAPTNHVAGQTENEVQQTIHRKKSDE